MMARLDVEEAEAEASRHVVEPSEALEWLRACLSCGRLRMTLDAVS